MAEDFDLSVFWCVNPVCTLYGETGAGNVFLKERYGLQDRALFQCKACKHCFSETRGTIFFGLNTCEGEVVRTLAMIPEKGGIRGAARATGHDKNTVCRWLMIAAEHCHEVTEYFLKNLISLYDKNPTKRIGNGPNGHRPWHKLLPTISGH